MIVRKSSLAPCITTISGRKMGVNLQKIIIDLRSILAFWLLFTAPALGQDISGYWLFYDVALKEKFSFYLPRIRGSYGEIPYKMYGARFLQSSSSQPTLKYRVRYGGVSFFSDDSGELFMSGTLNSDATEITGTFYEANGLFQKTTGAFVAQKQDPGSRSEIFQLIYLSGEYKSAPHCVTESDKDNAYSISLKCKVTQGVSAFRPTRSRGSPANWLAQPNTFLSEQACLEKLEEIQSASVCSELCTTPLCWD